MGNHIYVAGTATDPGTGEQDFCLMKVKPDGTPVWAKTLGGPGNERLSAMCRTDNGLLALTGTTNSFVDPGDPGNLYVVQVDSSGNLVRSKSIHARGLEVGYGIQTTTDQGFILAGSIDSGGVSRPYLVKTDAQLQTQWTRVYASSDDVSHVARSIIQTSSGGYAFVGEGIPSALPTTMEMCVVITDANGHPTANRHFAFNTAGYTQHAVHGNELIQNAAGELVIAGDYGGTYTMANQPIFSPMMVAVDLNANVVFERSYSMNSGDSRAHCVQATPDGGYIIGGAMGNYYAYMTKTDVSGAKQWSYYFSNATYSPKGKGFSVSNMPGGGFLLGNALLVLDKIRLVRTDAAGQSGCDQAIPFLGGDASNINLPSATQVWSSIEVGDTVATATSVQDLIITTDQVCTTVDVPAPLPSTTLLLYPNPSANLVQVEVTGADQLTVTNLLGQVMRSHTWEASAPQHLQLDVTDWAAGLYLVKAGTQVRRLVKE